MTSLHLWILHTFHLLFRAAIPQLVREETHFPLKTSKWRSAMLQTNLYFSGDVEHKRKNLLINVLLHCLLLWIKPFWPVAAGKGGKKKWSDVFIHQLISYDRNMGCFNKAWLKFGLLINKNKNEWIIYIKSNHFIFLQRNGPWTKWELLPLPTFLLL